MNEKEQKETKAEEERIRENGQVTLEENGKRIHLLSIIGEIEGHDNLSGSTKTTKYEHILPELAKVESDEKIGGVLILVNTIGGDVSCGLALAEMIASGVTTIADMYGHTDAVAQEVAASGISANLCCGGVQFTDTFDPATHHDCVVQRELTEKWHGYNDGQILVDASIHGEYTSHHPLWQWMADYAREHGLGMHVHISETRTEHAECLARHGKTPIQVLNDYGVWDVRAIAAHCVWTTPEDWSVMASKGVSAIHNPMSNLKLGSGIAPVPAMGKAGVNVCLGTDGVSSNNCTDFFGDMKLAAILHNGANCDPLALLPIDALRMATVNGGKALGRLTGRIEGGYDADLILVDFSHLNLTPCHSVISNLAYAAHGSDVCMNMARGKVIYRDGDFLTIDIDRVKREVADYALPLLFETK